MEYLAVIGISMFLIIPMIVAFYHQTTTLEDDIHAAQIEEISLELIEAAEEAYYLGPPTQQKLTLNFPPGVTGVAIHPQSVEFTYTTMNGQSTYIATTDIPVNLTGNLSTHQGRHDVRVEARQHTVKVKDPS